MMYLWGVKAVGGKTVPETSVSKAFWLPLHLQDAGICLDIALCLTSLR